MLSGAEGLSLCGFTEQAKLGPLPPSLRLCQPALSSGASPVRAAVTPQAMLAQGREGGEHGVGLPSSGTLWVAQWCPC